METVAGVFNTGLQPDGNGSLVVDLGNVEAVDSAAVSLLLSWLRRAQVNSVAISFSNVPANPAESCPFIWCCGVVAVA